MCWSNKSSVILFKTDVCSVINKGPDFKETTARSLYEAIYCCCESVSMFYKGMCHASVCMLVSVNTLLCVLFSCARAARRCKVFSSSLQWLQVPTRVHVSNTPTHSTWHCQEPSKNDPNQTSRALQETKTIRDKHPNRPHMKVIVRPERRAEMQRELKGIRNKRWGGQPWSRVNFTEGPK